MFTKILNTRNDGRFKSATLALFYEDDQILSFGYQALDIESLTSLIIGENFEDQDNDGFFISIADSIVKIQIYPTSDGDDNKESIIITLPHKLLKPTFENLLKLKIYYV